MMRERSALGNVLFQDNSVQGDGRKGARAELGAGLTDVLYGWNMCDQVDSFSARHVYNIGISDSMVLKIHLNVGTKE
jgi:hypothetical protein